MEENNLQPSANAKYYSTMNRASSYSLLEEDALLGERAIQNATILVGDGLLYSQSGYNSLNN